MQKIKEYCRDLKEILKWSAEIRKEYEAIFFKEWGPGPYLFLLLFGLILLFAMFR